MLKKNKLETTLFTHQVFQASVLPVKQTERKLEIDSTKVKSENFTFMWTLSPENLILLYVNNKGADQSLHPHNLVSVFVFLKITIKI